MIRQSIQRLAPFFIFTIDKFLIDPLLLKRRKISLPTTCVGGCVQRVLMRKLNHLSFCLIRQSLSMASRMKSKE